MVTGELKSKIDRVWDAFWSGGISNPLEVIEQITYLMFIRRLDDLQTAKERKANRDPNAPKRPPSAYLLFQNEIREEMRQRYKDLTYSEVLGKVSEAWKSLTEEQRKVSHSFHRQCSRKS